MWNYKYLSREHLEGFDNYKYMAVDTSPLSVYVMHPFWNKIVELVPKWVAPNALTFAGFLLTVADFLLLSYYDYDYTAASANATAVPKDDGVNGVNGVTDVIPRSVWFVLAVFLFLAYTLDGIDGKQARRTQTSGPLGELFDHGLDSYSVFFIPACLYSIFGRYDFSIPPIRMYFVMWNILFNFYLSHWEKYITGVLFLPWSYDFSMWASTFFFMWTGVVGTGFYKRFIFGDFTLANAFEVMIYGTGIFTSLPVTLYNIYKSYTLRSGTTRGGGGVLAGLRPLWSPLTAFLLCTCWVLAVPQVLQTDPRAVLLAVATLSTNVACRLIVAQMSGQRCELVNSLCFPLALAIAVSLALPQHAMMALYSVTAYFILAHIHYGTCVVRQMCDHFRISCFHIKQRSD